MAGVLDDGALGAVDLGREAGRRSGRSRASGPCRPRRRGSGPRWRRGRPAAGAPRASTPCWSSKASRVISSTRSRTPGRGFQTRRPSATAPSMSSASSSASSFSRKATISGDHSESSRSQVGRGQQGQPVDALGRLGRQLQRDPAAERRAHEGGAPDPQVVEHAQEVVGVGVLARRQRRAPVPAQVGDVQAQAVDALGQRVPHAPVDAARVDEDDVRRAAAAPELHAFAASWPHAASMSRPRVRRTVAPIPCSSRTAWKAAIASRLEPSYIPVGL